MNERAVDSTARPAIGRGFRLQWEPAQQASGFPSGRATDKKP